MKQKEFEELYCYKLAECCVNCGNATAYERSRDGLIILMECKEMKSKGTEFGLVPINKTCRLWRTNSESTNKSN